MNIARSGKSSKTRAVDDVARPLVERRGAASGCSTAGRELVERRGVRDAELGRARRRERSAPADDVEPEGSRARATSRPIAPSPAMPIVLPWSPSALPYSCRSHLPARSDATASGMRRSSASISPKTSSATAAAFLPGAVGDVDAALARRAHVDRRELRAGADDEVQLLAFSIACAVTSVERTTRMPTPASLRSRASPS